MPESNEQNNKPFYFTTLPNGWVVGRFRALEAMAGLIHAVTTRNGPDPAATARNVSAPVGQLADALDLTQIAFCRQVHGNVILPAERPGPTGEADGLVTNVPSLGLMGCSADCPLILAADPVTGAVGMAHASWRGTVRQIAAELILQLVTRFSVNTNDIVICICPSAGVCCYEVGQEIRQAAVDGIGPYAEKFFQQRDEKLYFDLWAANTEQLIRSGVRTENIHVAGVCTICRNDLFPSRRADGEAAGRFVAVVVQR
ncbi:MAG: peptidoglycan editing factor PgeF [Planctomycetota bacterium]|nr:peptidoglycan editing factor PgeF [Planctomycetota bacterium]